MQPALDLPAVEYAERTDPGRDPAKQVNEDACGRRETRFGHLCVVCDGMGGHAAGREAAQLALSTIFEVFDSTPEGVAPAEVLRVAIAEASRRVHTMPASEAALGRPGSTVVAVLMHGQGTEIAHVGDSRVYLVHEGQIVRATRDHSVVQEMVDRGLLTRDQAAHHPDANRITRALGMAPEVEAEVRPQPVHHVTGDAFVLCSDGLSDLVVDHEILDILDGVPAAQAVGKLVDLANARGGHDNITVVVLRARTTALAYSGAVAPTVAQTGVAQPPRTIPSSDATFVEPPRDRPTEVPHPTVPLEPTVPPSEQPDRERARGKPSLIVGLVLALVAAAVLADLLASHLAERRGKMNTPSRPPQASGPADASVAAEPTPLVPESVVLPPDPASSTEMIAPLEPGPSLDRAPRKKGKR
jgi:serine/threonine protein phosphatase PrpC